MKRNYASGEEQITFKPANGCEDSTCHLFGMRIERLLRKVNKAKEAMMIRKERNPHQREEKTPM